jgi:hypothetical protein
LLAEDAKTDGVLRNAGSSALPVTARELFFKKCLREISFFFMVFLLLDAVAGPPIGIRVSSNVHP